MIQRETTEKWHSTAWDIQEVREALPLPFSVLMGEALEALRFSQRYWEPVLSDTGQVIQPGLVAAVGNGRFHARVPLELEELYEITQEAQTQYRLARQSQQAAPTDRALFVLSEIRATLEWAFDDGQTNDADAQLEGLTEAHEGAASHDDLAAALLDYAGLAEQHQTLIDGLGGFQVSLIDEARDLAQALRERSAGPASLDQRPAEKNALDLRNRLVTLLYDRMLQIRAAARFIFRRHPKLLREVGSSYKRSQRAAQRRRRNQNTEAPTTSGFPTPNNPSPESTAVPPAGSANSGS